jgi:hypothetical protein
MQQMMQNCMDWFMSLGMLTMVLGVLLLLALVVLVTLLIVRTWGPSRRS